MNKPIPITAGRWIADQYGYEMVVIFACSIKESWVTTYGTNPIFCTEAAQMGSFVGRIFGGQSLKELKELRDRLDKHIAERDDG